MNDLDYPEAIYQDQGLPEYNENPLIAALPPVMSLHEVAKLLKKRPAFKKKELNLPAHIRIHAIDRLTRDFFVPQTNHIVIEKKFSQLIRTSYLKRNPKKAIFKRKLNLLRSTIEEKDITTYIHMDTDSPASSMTIAGISGAGKSTATNLILDSYPRVIYHPNFHLLQVPWLKVDCPHDGSISDFCISFFTALGRRLNIDYRAKYTSGRPTIGKMIADVASLCLIHAIGLLVIDEFQHMSLAKSGGEKKLINFLVTLVNVVEVSIVLIGTPSALRLFVGQFRQARRASGSGSVLWDRLQHDRSWDEFAKELWPYQWLSSPVEYNESIGKALYDLSQGIPDIAIKLFSLAQARALLLARNREEETLSIELFKQVFNDELSIVKPMIEALKNGNEEEIARCNDLIFPEIDEVAVNAFNKLVSQSLEIKNPIELETPRETSVAKSAIGTLVSMDISEDIAEALVLDAIDKKPDLSTLELIHAVTTELTKKDGQPEAPTKNKHSLVRRSAWKTLESGDLRKLYTDKTATMYECLHSSNLIFPVQALLAD